MNITRFPVVLCQLFVFIFFFLHFLTTSHGSLMNECSPRESDQSLYVINRWIFMRQLIVAVKQSLILCLYVFKYSLTLPDTNYCHYFLRLLLENVIGGFFPPRQFSLTFIVHLKYICLRKKYKSKTKLKEPNKTKTGNIFFF